MPTLLNFALTEEAIQLIIYALESGKGDLPPTEAEFGLARMFKLKLDSATFEANAKAAAAASTARIRAAKAAEFVITKRMAECLFVVSQGRYVTARVGRRRGGSMMGGATKRMVYELIEHGLLLDFSKITPEGLAKLDEWQRTHKPFAL